ncbi:hypothetical protein GCM10011369_06100 [Neiella marina]|uniref:Uncharacterized protein n=1 Tax=Neiella marina TaxID=508461 RepID=A0A8J2U2N6_9GAMM|nr:hypothetical protein [Neiella marina]GGA67231.1 hypothetical protein GCM10011369_06100 [Neiella marina]
MYESMKKLCKRRIMCCLLPVALAACGGGDGSSDSNTVNQTPLTGVFVGPVEGIHFRTVTQSGMTSDAGEFLYEDGESVTFAIGGIELPDTPAQSSITPLEIFEAADIDDPEVTNLARLLISIDVDGDTDNGINISQEAHDAAQNMTVDFADEDFDSDVVGLVANSGSPNSALVDIDQAQSYLLETIHGVELPSQFSYEWLGGRTLYIVWFDDDLGGVAEELTVSDDGSEFFVTGLINSDSDFTLEISITEEGLLEVHDNEFFKIVCGSTENYLKTHYIDNGEYGGTDLWFFDRDAALDFSVALTEDISPCESALE